MTPRLPYAAPAPDDAEREARHRILAELLAPYLDRELPAETAAQIDAHLVGCAECRRVLAVHAAVRDRLADEPVRPAPSALRDRIGAAVRALPPPLPAPHDGTADDAAAAGSARGAVRRHWWNRWVALALAAVTAGGAAVAWRAAPPTVAAGSAAPAALAGAVAAGPTVAAASVAMVDDALADYRRAMAGELPGHARDLPRVRAALPFPVEPLAGPDVHLVSAWTTTLSGEPAAALAYRWGDRVVVQYAVSERLFFRQPAVRQAVAARRVLVATSGRQSVLAWAEPASGALLVGDASPAELARVRGGTVTF